MQKNLINKTNIGFLIITGLVIVALLVVIPNAFLNSNGSATSPKNTQAKPETVFMNADMASWLPDHDPEEIAHLVDFVIIAIISSIDHDQARWNTPTGQRPSDWAPGKYPFTKIFTPFSAKVQRVIKGEVKPGDTLQFSVIGGKLDQDVLKTDTEIYDDLQVGDRAILYLSIAKDKMLYVAPYTYGGSMRLQDNDVVAGCNGHSQAEKCRVRFNAVQYFDRVQIHLEKAANGTLDFGSPYQ